MKHIISLFLVVILLLSSFPFTVSASDTTSDGLKYKVTNEKVTITTYTGSANSIVIPDTIDGYPVTAIGDNAFQGCTYLEVITIPDSVTTIGAGAFKMCANLVSINLPDGVTTIGNDMFLYCSNLTDLTLPDSVTTIGSCAFYGCYGLIDLILPDSVTTIGISAFGDCDSLISITIPNGVTTIGSTAFYHCSNLTTVTIPGSVTTIGKCAFESCTGLTSVTFLDGVTTIGTNAFESCTGLTSITIPDSVTNIGNYAFYKCSALASVSLGNNLTTIGENAFDSCTGLTSITIPDSVTEIGKNALENCSNLRYITFGRGLTKIGNYASNGYSSLSSVTILDGATTIGGSAFASCKKLTSVTIPKSVVTIGYRAFGACESLTDIAIPDSVTTIEKEAFESCTGLTSITIPAGVTTIKEGTFKNCRNLVSINLPDGLTTINKDAFYNTGYYKDGQNWSEDVLYIGNYCIEADLPSSYSTESYTVKAGTKLIADYAFQGSAYLDFITIPDSVTTIGQYAFSDCSVLYLVNLGNGVTTIGDGAFYGSGLYVVSLPDHFVDLSGSVFEDTAFYNNAANWQDGIFYIGNHCVTANNTSVKQSYTVKAGTKFICNYAFSCCEWADSITLSDSVTHIGSFAFSACRDLITITIPSGVTTIGNNAFEYCESLTDVNIPNGITMIGSNMFYECKNLPSITIPDSVNTIGSRAFYNCVRLSSITLPDSATTIGSDAFYNTHYYNTYSNWENDILYIGNHCCVARYTNVKNRIRSGTKTIAKKAFKGRSSLIGIIIPDSVVVIGDDAFDGCTNLTIYGISGSFAQTYANNYGFPFVAIDDFYFYDYTIENGQVTIDDYIESHIYTQLEIPAMIEGYPVTTIGDWAFSGCSSLSITIPDSVTTIGDDAFNSCGQLTSVTLPDSVTTIGKSAFYNCDSLTFITIPDGVITIGESAFKFCDSLTSIYVDENNPTYCSVDGILFDKDKTILMKYPGGKTGTAYTIPDGVTIIGDDAFYSCGQLTSVTLPDSVTTIGKSAFEFCDSLTSITIPDGVTTIGDEAFYYCKNLTSITIPDSVTTMGEDIFSSCESLSDIHVDGNNPAYCSVDGILFDKGKTILMKYPEGKTGTAYTIPDGVTIIGDDAFHSCGQLTSVTLPDSVTTIGKSAFIWCSSLTSITIPDSVTTIGDDAFYYCKNLTSITIPDSVLTIGSNVFYSCNRLAIYGTSGSYANTYANTNGIPFVDVVAQSVNKMIAALPTTVTLEDEAAIVAAREAYEGLTNTQKTYVTKLATLESAEAKLAQVKADNATAKIVDDMIIALPTTITVADKEAVYAARTAYEALTDAQKVFVSNLALLENAEQAIQETLEQADKAAAKTVDDMIIALPTIITVADEPAIVAARRAYLALTDSQRGFVNNLALLKKAEWALQTALEQANRAAAKTVDDMIIALPATITVEDEPAIVAAREAYNGLTDVQKEYVTNLGLLVSAEEKLEQVKVDYAAAKAVDDLIIALPATITAAEKKVVYAARVAYNLLTYSQKMLVKNLTVLETAERSLQIALEEADKAAAKGVDDLIEALPTTITMADREAVFAARAAYNRLTQQQRELVCEYETLLAAMEKLEKLSTVLFGDVNNDKRIDAKDALMVLKVSVGKLQFTPEETIAADVDGNAKIDAMDALYILKKAVSKIQWFPVEA